MKISLIISFLFAPTLASVKSNAAARAVAGSSAPFASSEASKGVRSLAIADPSSCYETTYEVGFVCPDFCGPGRDFRASSYLVPIYAVLCNIPGCVENAVCTNYDFSNFEPYSVCNDFCEYGITAGGDLRNCFVNLNGDWQCFMNIDSPVTFGDLGGRSVTVGDESGLLIVCPTLPEVVPDPDECDCEVVLKNPRDWDYTTDDFCQSCQILSADPVQGYLVTFDCSNKLEGD